MLQSKKGGGGCFFRASISDEKKGNSVDGYWVYHPPSAYENPSCTDPKRLKQWIIVLKEHTLHKIS